MQVSGSNSFKYKENDKNQQATSQNPMYVSIGSITMERHKRIKEAFNGLIHDSWTEKALRILSKMASSMKLSSKEDQVLINVIQANIGPINMYQSLVTQIYVNGHNFKSNHQIIQKFFQKILKVLFLTWLKFHSVQTLKKPSDMAQKLLCKLNLNFIILF